MLREAVMISLCAGLLTLGCSSGTASSEQTSAGGGGSPEPSTSTTSAGGTAPMPVVCGGPGRSGGEGSGGAGGSSVQEPVAMGCDASSPGTTTISCVESFKPGEGSGFGDDRFPDVIYGPPYGAGMHGGSTD